MNSLDNMANLAHDLKTESPYYPDYRMGMVDERYDKGIWVSSLLRKNHKGIWYTEHHFIMGGVSIEAFRSYPSIVDQTKEDIVRQLRYQVYKSMLFGVLDFNFKFPSGDPLWDKDRLQVSEEERLGLR